MSRDDSGPDDSSEQDGPSEPNELYRDWPHELTVLQHLGEEILEEWEQDNPNSPRDFPTAEWLVDNGYAHLRWVLKTKHGMGVMEFFVSLTSAGGSEDFDWDIDDVATIERAQAYLEDQAECREWRDSTRQTQRYRLNSMLQRFSEEYGDDSIIAHANDPSLRTEMYEASKRVIKDVREEQGSSDSGYQYMRSLHRFFEWLARADRIEYDPMEEIEEEFPWNLNPAKECLTDAQVRKLWEAADSDEEYVFVIGYCIWGLRTKELPAIHISQINFEGQEPTLEFEEEDRKNGFGTVTLLFGLDKLANYVETLKKRPGWNGYLFPSDDSDNEYLSRKTMLRRFKNLAKKANVMVEEDPATPKHGRSFYYNILTDAQTKLLDDAAEFAEEQGSMDPHSVIEHYLTEERKRRYLRVFFRAKIRSILPDDAHFDNQNDSSYDSSFDDF